jgi:hypothetical protein
LTFGEAAPFDEAGVRARRFTFVALKLLTSFDLDQSHPLSDVLNPTHIKEEQRAMRSKLIAAAAMVASIGATAASAQALAINLSGQFQCVQGCRGPGPAYVTQNGWELNLVNEVGQPSRAWIDYPGHLWAQYWHEGAVYSPDGMTIQFDNGSVWQRFVPPPTLNSRG